MPGLYAFISSAIKWWRWHLPCRDPGSMNRLTKESVWRRSWPLLSLSSCTELIRAPRTTASSSSFSSSFFVIWQMAQERSVPRFTSDWEKGRSWVGGPDDVTCLFSADLSSLGSGPFTCISLGCCNGFHQPTTLAHGQKELSWLLWAAISKVLLHQSWREGACRLLGDAILLTWREMQPLNTRS